MDELLHHKDCACPQCREALTTRQKLIAQDYKVSYSLAKACKSDLRKFHCNVDTSLPRAREARLSFLLLCLESAVHRGERLFLLLLSLLLMCKWHIPVYSLLSGPKELCSHSPIHTLMATLLPNSGTSSGGFRVLPLLFCEFTGPSGP